MYAELEIKLQPDTYNSAATSG